jgi:hypothetical protein
MDVPVFSDPIGIVASTYQEVAPRHSGRWWFCWSMALFLPLAAVVVFVALVVVPAAGAAGGCGGG